VPAGFGLRSENAAHRIAVEWDGQDGYHAGVYIPRRDSQSVLNVMAAGRLFPGQHHLARFDVRESAHDLHVAFTSMDGTAHGSVDVRVVPRLHGSALFADVQQASDFFRQGSAGYSAARDPHRLDGVQLEADRWRVEPVDARAVRSSFFDDPRRFPPGSAILDCALLMRDIPVTWSALRPMSVTRPPRAPADDHPTRPVT
jgi:hypothetical protein